MYLNLDHNLQDMLQDQFQYMEEFDSDSTSIWTLNNDFNKLNSGQVTTYKWTGEGWHVGHTCDVTSIVLTADEIKATFRQDGNAIQEIIFLKTIFLDQLYVELIWFLSNWSYLPDLVSFRTISAPQTKQGRTGVDWTKVWPKFSIGCPK